MHICSNWCYDFLPHPSPSNLYPPRANPGMTEGQCAALWIEDVTRVRYSPFVDPSPFEAFTGEQLQDEWGDFLTLMHTHTEHDLDSVRVVIKING